ncbi:CitMHS family citrate-Mg2+:H+ or citrate-Ca2+:H+ symporter [Murinocardiopsis flavida]|uniref:CitMHS family citrate-Mg2+:H+ or citrate-Ca2+:H+ symporter n=1 Tax=Murinocardiopsis flavida TaxID=645275 RepID=A0A2P8DQ56_9ACTN|nr:citrate:proton symporter [Murinocardiopsis flavida]PSK99355.1 CitMHS family citrate-Mg2+:H+ or citrate-Ca2+:H+ symporter [Murinocardiopsis flavida]
MLTVLGFTAIAVLLALLLSNRVTAVVPLIGVPLAAAAVAGFSPEETTEFVTAGLNGVAGTAAMFVFAILYFGVMRDSGLFDPIVRRVLRFAGRDPVTITVATLVLALLMHLDGAGATTFLITIPAMIPLYDALGMRRLVLAAVTGLGAGVMNVVPWGGPTARAAATIKVDANEIWVPLIPAQITGIIACFAIAYWLGRREQQRLRTGPAEDRDAPESAAGPAQHGTDAGTAAELARPRLFWFNAVLTLAVVGVLVSGVLPPELVFMIALVVALIVNYPGMRAQTERINAHAQGAMLMASTLLAAGVFLGVMEESGMIDGMAGALTGSVPDALGPVLPLLVGVLGVPMSLLFGPDAYYFAVLPVINALGAGFGIDPLVLTQASVVGQETVGFPISPLTGSFFLLTGLSGVPIGAHIRFLLPWAWLVGLVMLATAVLTGVIPLWAG